MNKAIAGFFLTATFLMSSCKNDATRTDALDVSRQENIALQAMYEAEANKNKALREEVKSLIAGNIRDNEVCDALIGWERADRIGQDKRLKRMERKAQSLFSVYKAVSNRQIEALSNDLVKTEGMLIEAEETIASTRQASQNQFELINHYNAVVTDLFIDKNGLDKGLLDTVYQGFWLYHESDSLKQARANSCRALNLTNQ